MPQRGVYVSDLCRLCVLAFGQSCQPNRSYWIDDGGPWVPTVAGDPAANRIGYQWTGVQPGPERWGIGSVAGSTRGINQIRAFYTKFLDQKNNACATAGDSGGGVFIRQGDQCWFTANGVNLHLGVDLQFVPARKAHPGFVVKSLSALKNRLEAAGIEIVWDTQISGFERFYASDPFGNRLEFMEPTDSRRNIRSL